MTRDADRVPSANRIKLKLLGGFALTIAILAYFGYVVGKDMALRDNAREAATQAVK